LRAIEMALRASGALRRGLARSRDASTMLLELPTRDVPRDRRAQCTRGNRVGDAVCPDEPTGAGGPSDWSVERDAPDGRGDSCLRRNGFALAGAQTARDVEPRELLHGNSTLDPTNQLRHPRRELSDWRANADESGHWTAIVTVR
jgi:hypothetical protein